MNSIIPFISNISPDGSCINEVSIAQSIISQALPALSPRLNLSFSPKTSDRTRLVDSLSYPQTTHNLEMSKIEENPVPNTTQEENQETELQTPKANPKVDSNKVQTVVTPSKWPLKPGVLVHVNSNHTLSPKNQARLQTQIPTEESNLGLLERPKTEDKTPPKTEYSKKNGKPRQNVVSGILKNLRRKSEDSDDDSGKYKKINKTNKRAMSLVNMNKSGCVLQKNRLRSLFQSEKPNIIVTEGGSCLFKLKYSMVMGDTIHSIPKITTNFYKSFFLIFDFCICISFCIIVSRIITNTPLISQIHFRFFPITAIFACNTIA